MKDNNTINNLEIEFEKQRILNMINNIKDETPNKPTESIKKVNRFKLYLNNLIKLFTNRKNKLSLTQKIRIIVKHWWMNEQTETIKDLVKFVIIHGFMGMSILLCLLTVTNVNITLIGIIKQNVLLTSLIYLIGTGSAYYLLLDLNKVLFASWGIKNKR
jgi:hypothetical protein